jgi:hypothetical protein
MEERHEAEVAMAQAGDLLRETQEMLEERRTILEAAELAKKAAREHELAMEQLACELEEVRGLNGGAYCHLLSSHFCVLKPCVFLTSQARLAKTEAEKEGVRIQRDRAQSRIDRSRRAEAEAREAQAKAQEEARLAEDARKAQEEAEARVRAEEADRLAEESRMANMKEEELRAALQAVQSFLARHTYSSPPPSLSLPPLSFLYSL